MDTKQFKTFLQERSSQVEAFLAHCLEQNDIPARLRESMNYSLLAGGKRLRPVLCLSCASLFGVEMQRAMPFAAGIELIHTYSLIHDDLPAMDNDDFRRGRPSNHKAFDEATAILAGDALLTEAFVFMASNRGRLPAEAVLAALLDLARAAGAAGMVGGQMLDMQYTGEGSALTTQSDPAGSPGTGHDSSVHVTSSTAPLPDNEAVLAKLRAMHAKKTGALLKASCTSGVRLALTNDQAAQETANQGRLDLKNLEAYGEAIGMAFQITDDLLDIQGDAATLGKPVGSDLINGKLTYPALLGVEESERLAREECERAVFSLASYSGQEADFLRALAHYILHRIN